MSLLDNVRHTLEQAATRAGEAASNAREMGQNLSAQAQIQINIKKLQLERREKHRELGESTYAWYQSGSMIVSGPAPAEVHQILLELDDTSTRLRAEEANLEDAKRQAALRAQNKDDEGATYSVLPETNTTEDTMDTANTYTGTTSSGNTNVEKSTQKLSAEGGVTMPGTGIITNPTPPVSDPEAIPPAVPSVPGSDTPITSIPSNDTPIPSPAPDGPGAGIGSGTGVGIGTGISTPGSIPGGTF